jgi:hypothetical protein
MKKIKIGEFEYSRTKIKNNILRVYADSLESEKNDWYRDAHQWAVDVSNFLYSFKRLEVSVRQILGITSALSPLKEWEKNKELTVDIILTGDCGHMKNNKLKANKIIMASTGISDDDILKILNGKKTQRFYMNMMHPNDGTGVTVDRHAIAIAIGRTATEIEQVLTIPKYKFIENCYKMAAGLVGLTPLHLQSITWQAWKRIKSKI